MPYFVYKVFPARRYEKVESFDQYREARTTARELRMALQERDTHTVRIVHASTPAEAERLMSERREPPPLGEDG